MCHSSLHSRTMPERSLAIVVAHHSDSAFIELLSQLEQLPLRINVFVYDKSTDGIPAGASQRLPPSATVQQCPNVGREAETYLRHIADNYDTLADWTLFIQDDTATHIPPGHCSTFIRRIDTVMQSEGDGEIMQVVYRGKRLEPLHEVSRSKEPMYERLAHACAEFGIDMPLSYTTHTCAFMLISRDAIIRRSHGFYTRLQAWTSVASVANKKKRTQEQLAPWLLELLWQLIFFTHANAHDDSLQQQGTAAAASAVRLSPSARAPCHSEGGKSNTTSGL
jgi:hypothetical protein